MRFLKKNKKIMSITLSEFYFKIIFVFYFLLLVWITFKLLRKDRESVYKLLSILAIWLVPVVGLLSYLAVDYFTYKKQTVNS